MPTAPIANPAGAYGGTKTGTERAGEFGLFVATTAITAKRVVAWDVANSGQVIQAATGTAPLLCFGIALENIAAGAAGQVAYLGPVFSVAAQGTIAAGDLLTRSGTTAGSVATLATSTGITTYANSGQVVGVALSAAAGNLVDLFLLKF